jgi:hypothetical protein
MAWQLKKLSTNEPLSEVGDLPENWGPILGMSGIKEKLGDLSWLGESFKDMGWLETPETEEAKKQKLIAYINKEISRKLEESNWTMLEDSGLTAEQKFSWKKYRKALREIKFQPNYPINFFWPSKPV